MSLTERLETFNSAVLSYFAIQNKKEFRSCFGVSNGARVVEGGLLLGVNNLNAFSEKAEQCVLGCMLRFPPEDEVYFALQIKSGLPRLRERLCQMKRLGAMAKQPGIAQENIADDENEEGENLGEADLIYSDRNNLAVLYLAKDGNVYLRNKGFWESLPNDLTPVGPGVPVDSIMVSVWPPAASARRSLLAREFVGYLADFVDKKRVHEIPAWDDPAAVSSTMRRLPDSIPIEDIEAAVSALGGYYPHGEVRRFHTAVNFLAHKHFVIITGLSGTGKTQLARKYARAIHGMTSDAAPDPFVFVCPVRPEWTDPTGLTGYYDVLSNRYVVPRFLEAVLIATAHKDTPVFVVLDEMNLARVEYYFSDVLSCIETGDDLQLHSHNVPLEGTTGTSIRSALPLPPNLYVVGTINIDESTNPVSDKVLDRAIVIEMSAVDICGFLKGLESRDQTLKESRAACEDHLVAVHRIMEAHGPAFGYRVAEEVVRYHKFAAASLRVSTESVLDDLMVEKVLVKLRGTEKQRPMLVALLQKHKGLTRSTAFLQRLISDLDEFGSFQATR